MQEKVSNIAKNTSYFTFALVLQKVITFTYFTIMARALGPENLGKYYFAISFTSIFSIFIDLGMANVLTRETAKIQKNASSLLGNILAIKIPLAVIVYLLTILMINLMDYPEITRTLVYLSATSMVLDSFTLTFFAVSRGFHTLSFESVASVIFQLIVLSLGLTILKLHLGLRWLMGSLVAASSFNFIYSLSIIVKKWGLSVKPRYNLVKVKSIIKIAWPFAAFAIFSIFYTYFDSIMLSNLSGDKYVGYYQVAFKILNALQFLPMAFTASLYPAFAMYWAKNRDQLQITFERAINYLIIISLPISIGIFSLADKIVLLFKSGYSDAILPLQLIMIGVFFIFTTYPIGSFLNACDRQRINTINMGITLFVSIIMNYFLIKFFQSHYNNGAIGASITSVATNFLLLILGLIQIPKIIKLRAYKILPVFFKAACATAIMALMIFVLKPYINMFLIIGLSGFVYFAGLYLAGGFKKEDVASILKSFDRKRTVVENE